MHSPRRSEKSHELTQEERSRGGRMRAAKIYEAKSRAAAEGKPYKPLRRRRRSSFGISGDPYTSPAWQERIAATVPEDDSIPPGLDELTDDEVAAAARVFWLDELCERRDAEHDEGVQSFILYE